MTDFDANTAIEAAIKRKSDAEREEERRLQVEQLANMTLPTALEIRAQLGKRMVASAEQALQHADNDDEYDRLAEGLALQGFYREALETARQPARIKEYAKIIEAVTNPITCNCPKTLNGQATLFIKDTIVFDGEIINLKTCTLCKHLTC